MENKLVVLGIPWDVDTDGLRDYMSKFGQLDDCIVMKERSSGRSRGFGYVTFTSLEDAKKVLATEHSLGGRSLEVKVATPKEEMKAPAKKVTRIFVAKIPPAVTEEEFKSHFGSYGEITDIYMPKDPTSKGHRGIGFITFASTESVERLMAETHELGGATLVVDRATPKEEEFRPVSRISGGYGAYNAYINAATRYAALGAPTLYDHPLYGRMPMPPPSSGEMPMPPPSVRGMGKKIFVGRLPPEATTEDLQQYFSRFGRLLDVYIPKDPKRAGHRGFGFVTFAEDGVTERISRRPHEICGHQVAIDSATPLEDTPAAAAASNRGNVGVMENNEQAHPLQQAFGGFGPMRTFGRMYGGVDFDDQWGYGMAAAAAAAAAGVRTSRADWRYRPY